MIIIISSSSTSSSKYVVFQSCLLRYHRVSNYSRALFWGRNFVFKGRGVWGYGVFDHNIVYLILYSDFT